MKTIPSLVIALIPFWFAPQTTLAQSNEEVPRPIATPKDDALEVRGRSTRPAAQDVAPELQALRRDCRQMSAVIKVGMTRGEIEALMEHDGGLAGIYKCERLFFRKLCFQDEHSRILQCCKLNIDFRPYGLPDEIYRDANRFAQWVKTGPFTNGDPKDIVVKISEPYTDYLYSD